MDLSTGASLEHDTADAVNADFERRLRLAPSPPLLSPPLPTSPREFVTSPISPCSPLISPPRGRSEKPSSSAATTSPPSSSNARMPTKPCCNPQIPKTKKLTHTITPPWIEREEPPTTKVARAVSLPFPSPMSEEAAAETETSVTIYYSGTSSEASRQPFGGTSTTRDATCFIVREKVIVPGKKGAASTANYRNVVFAVNMNGINLLHPFTETLICNYPFREIKLWKTYPNAFYFLWCPQTARYGIPLLFETRQGEDILKAIHESVAKILEQRKQAAATGPSS